MRLQCHITAVNRRSKGAAIWADEHSGEHHRTVCVHRNEACFIYIIYDNIRLTTFTKYLPKCHLCFCYIFLSRSGAPPMTLLTAGLLSLSQTPSCPRQLQTCAPLMHEQVPPSQPKSPVVTRLVAHGHPLAQGSPTTVCAILYEYIQAKACYICVRLPAQVAFIPSPLRY